jgi:segregation and condensation protein A
MAITPAHEAIAKIIELAENGEINPWDVPVIDIIDRFLAELGLIDSLNSPLIEADLPQSGQAFVWASMLVLLKAETLQLLQQPEELEFSEFDEEEDCSILANNRRTLPIDLERHLRRRSAAAPIRTRRVTLQELIEQLEHIAAELEAVSSNSRPRHNTSRSRQEAIRAIAQLAHNENLTELAMQLEQFLYRNLPQLFPQQNYINWEQLLHCWHQNHHSVEHNSSEEHSTSERAGIFWALLLLSSQSKVELWQEEFYQDLSIRPLNS